MITYSQQYLKRRKFLMVLPLIVVPFLTLLFWLLGGGSGSAKVVTAISGLNTQLPDANLKQPSALDKMSFYAMADRDSVKRKEQVSMDPNFQHKTPDHVDAVTPSDELLNRKIARLEQVINEPYEPAPRLKKAAVDPDGEVEKLEELMQTINQRRPDPEMEALNRTLDKLLAIQHPAQTSSEISPVSQRKVFGVTVQRSNHAGNYFGQASSDPGNSFFSTEGAGKDSLTNGVIIAVVHSQQTLQTGSVVKLRLLQDVFVNGEKIPNGSFVFGHASIEKERLQVSVSSIQFQNRLYPVALTVYDMDGLNGIYIPGSGSRDVVKQSTEQGLQSIGGLSFDPSLKAQAAATGIHMAKSLFSKQVKQVRVTVKAGYRILLKDDNEKSNL